MEIFKRQTVHQVKEAYPFLNSVAKRYPHFFNPNLTLVNVHYRIAKVAFHLLLTLSSWLIAAKIALSGSPYFIPAFSIGVGIGGVAYLVQKLIRRKMGYEGTWLMLYAQGCTLLQKRWRYVEAAVLGGASLGTYLFTARLMQQFPTLAIRQSGLFCGFWAIYIGCNTLETLFKMVHGTERNRGPALARV